MLTEKDIKLHTFYGPKGGARVAAFTWEDGEEGVNYSIEGMTTMLPMFTSKANFLAKANAQPVGALLVADAMIKHGARGGEVINPEAQTDEQRNFLAVVMAMKEDK